MPFSRFLSFLLFPILISVAFYYWNYEQQEQLSFRVVPLPGKGKGLIATRNISRGDLILRDKPLFVLPSSIRTSPHALISSHLANLTPLQRTQFYDLSYLPVRKEGEIPLSIFQTNAVAASPGTVGLFPTFARLNHACAGSFNAFYSFRETQGEIFVFAIKDINEGSEILTTYFNTKQSRSDRQSYLSQNYGFQCDCHTCTLPLDLARQSDTNLQRMSSLYSRLALWSSNPTQLRVGQEGQEAVETAREIWKIGAEEEYVSERGQLAADVVRICLAHSDARATREWGELAIRWYGHELGRDCIQIGEMRKVIARPEAVPGWGSRRPMIIPGTEGLVD